MRATSSAPAAERRRIEQRVVEPELTAAEADEDAHDHAAVRYASCRCCQREPPRADGAR